MDYYVYIIANKVNTCFYIGVTNNLARRLYEHRNKLVPGFAERYNCNKLIYFEMGGDAYSAISREKQLKHWSRSKKLELIKSMNPNMEDLGIKYELYE